MIFAIKKQHAVLAVQIKYPVSVSQYRIKESIIFTKLSLENHYLEVQNTSCNRNEPKQSISTAWNITEGQTLRNGMQLTSETMQTCDFYKYTLTQSNDSTLLIISIYPNWADVSFSQKLRA